MKIHEVLAEAMSNDNPFDVWFRPITWRKSGMAFALDYDLKSTVMVPNSTGGIPQMTKEVVDLMADWEIVSPDFILEETQEIMAPFE